MKGLGFEAWGLGFEVPLRDPQGSFRFSLRDL